MYLPSGNPDPSWSDFSRKKVYSDTENFFFVAVVVSFVFHYIFVCVSFRKKKNPPKNCDGRALRTSYAWMTFNALSEECHSLFSIPNGCVGRLLTQLKV
jgi:hypothetical protein